MSNNTRKNISTLLVIAVLINAIIIVVYISFVFREDSNLFNLDRENLEKRISIYIDSLSDKLDYYDSRMSKIIESYRFIDFINTSVATGVDKDEVKKIISLFRDGENPFSSVALYDKEGLSIFSAPIRITSIDTNLMSLSNSFYSSYNDAYDGIEFTSNIKDNSGVTIGYIVASVDKSIFNNIVQNSSILLLPNAVIYYNNDININSVPKEYLISLLDNMPEFEPYFQDVKDSSLLFYSSKLSDVQNLNIGFLSSDIHLLHKYLKYIILAVLSLSLIFLVSSVLFEVIKGSNYTEVSSLNEAIEEDNIALIDEEIYTKDIDETENIQSDILIEDIIVDDINETIVSKHTITETTGSTLDEEISKQEEEYFASKEAFDVHYDNNFLSDTDRIEPQDQPQTVSSFLNEEINTEDLFKNLDIDKELEIISESGLLDDESEDPKIEEEPSPLVDSALEEVPKIPDDYYGDEAIDDISPEKKWNNIIDSLGGKKFVNKNMNEMIEWVQNNANVNPDSALMLEYNLDTKSYIGVDNYNLSYETQTLFTIDEEEPLFANILSNHKPLSIVNPFESASVSTKVSNDDKLNISKMLLIPIEDKRGAIKSFFVLSSKE